MLSLSVEKKRVLVLEGKHSGRHAFAKKLEELGYQLSEENSIRAFQRFKQLADQKKSPKQISRLLFLMGYPAQKTYIVWILCTFAQEITFYPLLL